MLHTRFDPLSELDPFAGMRHMQNEMNRMFGGPDPARRTTSYPPMNFWVGPDSIVMTAELPGLSDDSIDLTVHDTMISVQGEFVDQDSGDDLVWHRRERPKGKFSRSVELPFRVDANKIEARFESGVLTVEMQRPEEEKPKRIEIKS